MRSGMTGTRLTERQPVDETGFCELENDGQVGCFIIIIYQQLMCSYLLVYK